MGAIPREIYERIKVAIAAMTPVKVILNIPGNGTIQNADVVSGDGATEHVEPTTYER